MRCWNSNPRNKVDWFGIYKNNYNGATSGWRYTNIKIFLWKKSSIWIFSECTWNTLDKITSIHYILRRKISINVILWKMKDKFYLYIRRYCYKLNLRVNFELNTEPFEHYQTAHTINTFCWKIHSSHLFVLFFFFIFFFLHIRIFVEIFQNSKRFTIGNRVHWNETWFSRYLNFKQMKMFVER